jgi:Zn-finger nucleic acid-binding protein
MPKPTSPRVNRTICPSCKIGPMTPDKKDSFKATCPTCRKIWNFDIMHCPTCNVLLLEMTRGVYKCFKCVFAPMKEKELQEKVEQYYSGQGYIVLKGCHDNGPGTDLILYQKATNYVVVIEVKGENPSQINGLTDVQKALGQIIEHIDNPQGTNANILEPLAASETTFIYAIAAPYTHRYLKWCNERVSQSTRKKLNLHWLFVERNEQVTTVGPLNNFPTALTIQTTQSSCVED